ncbi:MAG: microcompartment protein, partial [Clostridia bacterium]|nr:microcompartment protein [Clostridia bacterium]
GEAAGNRVGKVVASHVIPRPHEELEKIIYTLETRESIITKEEKKDIQKRQEQQAQDKHKIKKKKKE